MITLNSRFRLGALSFALIAGSLSALGGATQQVSEDAKQTEQAPARTWHLELGKLAPDFELTDTKGEAWKLSEQRGKVVVLEWYNPACPVVQKAHAPGGSLAQLGNDAIDKGVVWVAVNSGAPKTTGADAEANEAGIKSMGLEYPVLLDPSGWVGRMYEATNTPHMFIIDKAGKLIYRGAHEDKEGVFLVEKALLEHGSGNKVSSPRTNAFGCQVHYGDKAELGMVAPNFTLPDLGEATTTLSDLRGSYVVLEWFNPGCPVVKEAHSEGGALETCAARQMKQGVKWLAVNSGAPGKQGTTVASNLDAKKRWNLGHPILLDAEGKVGRLYGAKTTPQMVLIDPRGVIVYEGAHQDRKTGGSYIDQALEELRAGKAVSVPKTQSFGCGVKYGN